MIAQRGLFRTPQGKSLLKMNHQTNIASGDAQIGSVGQVATEPNSIVNVSAEIADSTGSSLQADCLPTKYRISTNSAPVLDGFKEFFARPVLVGTHTWSTSLGSVGVISPFDEWLQVPSIVARLKPYRHYRGTAVVTITTVTSPHHVGRTQFSLTPPFPGHRISMLNAYSVSATDNSLVVDASTANSITLKLPYSGDEDWWVFPNNGKQPAELIFSTICPLTRDDGGVVGTPRFSIFASIEDIEVGGISPYQTSGWEGVRSLIPISIQNMISTNIAGDTLHEAGDDQAVPLTLSGVGKSTMKTSELGFGLDGITWKNTIGRYGLVGLTPWTYGLTAGTKLITIPVTPDVCYYDSAAVMYRPTPCSFIAEHFQAWQGTMKIKIVVAASPYIKGQLLVVYTPHYDAVTTSLTEFTSEAQYCILNVNQEFEKEFEIGWSTASKLIKCGMPKTVGGNVSCNGFLHVVVFEPLVSSAPVNLTIASYIAAGDDFRFYGTSDHPRDYVVSSSDYTEKQLSAKEASEALDRKIQEALQKPLPNGGKRSRPTTKLPQFSEDKIKKFYKPSAVDQPYQIRDPNKPTGAPCRFGEYCKTDVIDNLMGYDMVKSLRSALSRYKLQYLWTNAVAYGESTSDWLIRLRILFPQSPSLGKVNKYPVNNSPGGEDNPMWQAYNLHSALRACFVGYVGSVRHKFVIKSNGFLHDDTGDKSPDKAVSVRVAEFFDYNEGFGINNGYDVENESAFTAALSYGDPVAFGMNAEILMDCANGAVHQYDSSGSALVVTADVPYVSQFRYGRTTVGLAGPGMCAQLDLVCRYPQTSFIQDREAYMLINDLTAIGDDYDLYFYLCTPSSRLAPEGERPWAYTWFDFVANP